MALWWIAVAVGAPTLISSSDLEEDDGGLISSGDTMQWQWGAVQHLPGSGVDGAYAWSTRLLGDTFNDTTDRLEIPLGDLSGLSRPMLRFSAWYQFGAGDRGWIEVDEGDGWKAIAPVYGYPWEGPGGEALSGDAFEGESGGWQEVVVDLSGMATPKLRLVFAADEAGGGPGWTVDNLQIWEGDIAPPGIGAVTTPGDTEDLAGPYAIRAAVTDDQGLTAAAVEWVSEDASGARIDGGTAPLSVISGALREALIPAQPPGATVRAVVTASDGANTARRDAAPFRVYLAAPRDLACPDRVIADQADLSWSPPAGAYAPLGYAVYRDALPLTTTADTTVVVPLAGDHTFTVRARYLAAAGPRAGEILEGDPADPCAVHALVPAVTALDPAEGWPGDQLRVDLQGEWLLMAQGAVAADLGEGIEVTAVDVRDVDRARLHLSIAADAAPGPRSLALSLPSGEVAADLFAVLDPADRPRLTGVTPARLTQGERAWLEISLVGPLSGDSSGDSSSDPSSALPAVDLGEGVIAEEIQVVPADGPDGASGYLLRVLAVASATAPLGDRAIRVDDGVRLFSGATLEIRDQPVIAQRTCSASPGAGPDPATPLLLALAALAIRRARGYTRTPA